MLSAEQSSAVVLSLWVAATAVTLSLPFGVAAGWVLAKRRFPGKAIVETLINLPLVLPPVVTGYLLLVTFGRRGLIGGYLESLGLRLVFDWKGAALASAVMGFPLLVRPIRLAFTAVDDGLLQAARTLGATRLDAFWSIALPLAGHGVLGGCILAFARSMGEFGATLMIAGNIAGQTRTIPLQIYTLLDAPGGGDQSVPLIVVAILISAGALLTGEYLERRGQRRLRGE